MSDRRKVLDLFEAQKDFMEEKVNAGIEQYRKGYAHITVVDSCGNPVPNAVVKVNQKSHEFRFGANLFMLEEFESEEKNDLYKKYFADTFNIATLPFYWNATEPKKGLLRYDKDSVQLYRRPAIDLCMEFCREHNIEPREHGLAYEHMFPDWLQDASVFEIKSHFVRRCEEISSRYRDKIPTIEVTNEMDWAEGKTIFYDDPEYAEWCYKTAAQYFPANQLVINEGTVHAWEDHGRTCDQYYQHIASILESGARIDAIGMQFHTMIRAENEYPQTQAFYNPERLYAHMDLYSAFGKPLQVTEITIPAYSNDPEDEAIQAEILEKLYSIWFSHPNMEQIIYWNLVDGYAYVNNPTPDRIAASQGDMTVGENRYYGGLLRFDMTPKPAFYAIKNLIEKKWHTEAQVTTSADGKATFKGFYGEYDVEIVTENGVINRTISLKSKSKKNITIKL